MTISIVIPVYNELEAMQTLPDRLLRVRQNFKCDSQVIFVDDGSNDGTENLLPVIADNYQFQVWKFPRNSGRGAALRKGLALATGEVVVVMDADLEHYPEDLGDLLLPIFGGDADVVVGNRYAAGAYRNVDRFGHRLCNRLLTWWVDLWSGLDLEDVACGYRAMRREVADKLVLHEDRFGTEIEMQMQWARAGVRIAEVPVRYRARVGGKKLRLWRDGFKFIWLTVRYRLWP